MFIKHHFCVSGNARLQAFLEQHNVKYEIAEFPVNRIMYVFDLYQNKESYNAFKLRFPIIAMKSIKSSEFSKEEIENSKWLTVRSISSKVNWEFDEDAFEQLCAYKRWLVKDIVYHKHCLQTGELTVKKEVNWGARHFFSGPSTADDFLFCSEKAKTILDNRWQGLEFWSVKRYNQSGHVNDLFQMYFSQTLPFEAMIGGSVTKCNTCGRKIVRLKSDFEPLRLDGKYLLDTETVYKTGDVLTNQLVGHLTHSVNIVPKSFYQFCEKNHMNRGMVYEPIELL